MCSFSFLVQMCVWFYSYYGVAFIIYFFLFKKKNLIVEPCCACNNSPGFEACHNIGLGKALILSTSNIGLYAY